MFPINANAEVNFLKCGIRIKIKFAEQYSNGKTLPALFITEGKIDIDMNAIEFDFNGGVLAGFADSILPTLKGLLKELLEK